MITPRLAIFATACALLLGCAEGDAQSGLTITPVGSTERLPARLIKPAGPGPFPAIVIMHDCSGVGPRSSGAPGRWASRLVVQGYAVLIPDSFGPRGLANGVCTMPGEQSRAAAPFVRAADAYGALAYLRTLPEIDGTHVGIMGGSHGGSTVLATMFQPVANGALAAAKRDGFAAAVALYPGCTGNYGSWHVTRRDGITGPATSHSGVYKPLAPLHILIGAEDDWTPAEPCRWLVDAGKAAGYPLDITVYPGANHSFDSAAPVRYVGERNNPNAPTGKGATTGGDAAAWADAEARVREFFARYLKGANGG